MVITITSGCEGGFTKVTVDSPPLMDSFDVVRTTFLESIAFITKITVEFFLPDG